MHTNVAPTKIEPARSGVCASLVRVSCCAFLFVLAGFKGDSFQGYLQKIISLFQTLSLVLDCRLSGPWPGPESSLFLHLFFWKSQNVAIGPLCIWDLPCGNGQTKTKQTTHYQDVKSAGTDLHIVDTTEIFITRFRCSFSVFAKSRRVSRR